MARVKVKTRSIKNGRGKNKVKNVRKEKNKILYLIAGLLAAIVIFTAITMMLMVKDEVDEKDEKKAAEIFFEPPPEIIEEPHLYVEDVFFLKTATRADEDKVDILTTVYITNDGLANAKDVKIIAWPIDEKKNLALDKAETPVENIPVDKTTEIEFDIEVPAGAKHDVDLLIFERGKLILRGSGAVVIEGSPSNVQKYQTKQVMGTGNDSDYDGMADAWEIYYGLDPYDPNDAMGDLDNDGVTNIGEYQSGTEPAPPMDYPDGGDGGDDDDKIKEEKEDTGMLMSSSPIWVIIFIIVFILIGLVVVKVSKHQNRYNQRGYTQQHWSDQNRTSANAQYQQTQSASTAKRCQHCSGWVINEVCIQCGTQNPTLDAAAVQNINNNVNQSKLSQEQNNNNNNNMSQENG